MTNPDNVGGLPEFVAVGEFVGYGRVTGEPHVRMSPGLRPGVRLFTEDQMREAIELYRSAPAGGDGLAERICDYLCDQEYDIGGRDELLAHIRNAMRTNEADGGGMSDELFAELELSVKQADEIIRSDKGCGACGDGCSDRNGCRLAEESPRCLKCHGTLEVLMDRSEPWSASAYAPCPDCHPAAKKDSAPAGSGEVDGWKKWPIINRLQMQANDCEDAADENSDAVIMPLQLKALAADLREAAALLRKLQQGADGWRPIETAPKDGRRVLAFAGARPFIARHGRTVGWWDDNDLMRDPTHWRPLPDSPASQDQEGGANG